MLAPISTDRPADHNATLTRSDSLAHNTRDPAENLRHWLPVQKRCAGTRAVQRSPCSGCMDQAIVVGKRCVRNPRRRDQLTIRYGSGKNPQPMAGLSLRPTDEAARKRVVIEGDVSPRRFDGGVEVRRGRGFTRRGGGGRGRRLDESIHDLPDSVSNNPGPIRVCSSSAECMFAAVIRSSAGS
jgi:hypothetical protein